MEENIWTEILWRGIQNLVIIFLFVFHHDIDEDKIKIFNHELDITGSCVYGTDKSHYNRPISQFPQFTSSISHNASFFNRNVHMCALLDIARMHCGICEMGLFSTI